MKLLSKNEKDLKKTFSKKLFFLILLLIIVAGCGDKCILESEWDSPGRCFSYSCSKATGYNVNPIPIDGCTCGDKTCDASIGENSCTCIEDCGPVCGTKKQPNEFLKEQCFDKNTGALCKNMNKDSPCECLLDIDQEKIEQKSESINIANPSIASIEGKLAYQQPLDLKKSMFNVEFYLKKWNTNIKNLEVKSIEIFGNQAGKEIKLGSLDINQKIWDENNLVKRKIIPSGIKDFSSGQLTNIKIIISGVYDFGAKELPFKTQQILQGSTLDYVKASKEVKCVSTACNDDNSATKDICAISGTAFCRYEPISGKCGNYECEATENKCTCPQDCGNCEGSVGKYMYKDCSSNSCVAKLNAKIDDQISQTKVIDVNIPMYKLTNEVTYKEPWVDISDSQISFNIVLKENTNPLGRIKISSISVFEGDIRWLKIPASGSLNNRNDATNIDVKLKNIPMQEYKDINRLKFVIEYEYPQIVRGEQKTIYGEYQIQLVAAFTLVDPQ